MRSSIDEVLEVLKENCQVEPGDKILIAVSGGVDSMVLLDMLQVLSASSGFTIGVCHLDHMYRGDEAIGDAVLVKDYCKENQIPCYSYRRPIEKIASAQGKGFEEMARSIRYSLFDALAKTEGYTHLATAHHMDDQAETVLMHLFRGSGLDGLKGIRYKSGVKIRPLLNLTKVELLEYAVRNKVPYREDKSNSDTRFSRNKIRTELLPLLKRDYDPQIVAHLNQLSQLVVEDVSVLDQITSEAYAKLVTTKDGHHYVDRKMFLSESKAIRRRVLRHIFDFENGHVKNVLKSHIDALVDWIEVGRTGSVMNFHGVRFEHRGNCVKFMLESRFDQLGLKADKRLNMGTHDLQDWGLRIVVENVDESGASNANEMVIERSVFEEGIMIRTRREKDKIRLAGMGGSSKSVKKLLIDLKLSADEKASVPLIASSDEVLWVVGRRKSIYAQSQKKTGDFVRITIQSL